MHATRRAFGSAFAAAVAAAVLDAPDAQASTDKTKSAALKIGRRVVTGFDKAGRSTIVQDGPAPKAAIYPDVNGYNAWLVNSVPANLSDFSDPMLNGYHQTAPPPGGVVARITTWDPGYVYPMHTTETVDFGIVLSGRIELGLEHGSTILEPGDFVVQQGTPHLWKVG